MMTRSGKTMLYVRFLFDTGESALGADPPHFLLLFPENLDPNVIQTTQDPAKREGTKPKGSERTRIFVMNAWIDTTAEMTGMGRWGVDVSLSDLSILVPDARWLMMVGAIAAFCLVAACQDGCIDRRENKKSDGNRQ